MERLAPLLLLLPLAAVAEAPDPLAPRVRMETTAGSFVIELDVVRAPLTAQNFLAYVREGFYDGTVMHRVIPGFVVQGGGFDRSYALRPTRGPIPNESGNGLSNRRGSVGLARGDSPHSGTSQFYVNLEDNRGLDPLPTRWGYAVFGRVVEGMDVVDRISHQPTGAAGPFPEDAPLTPVLVTRAAIVGEASAAPTPAPADATPAEPPPPPADREPSGEPPTAEPAGAESGTAEPPPAEEPPGGESRP